MADMFQQFNEQMTTTPLARKIALLLILAATVAGRVVLWLWVQKPEFQILYTNLSSEDAASVVAKLKEGRIPMSFRPTAPLCRFRRSGSMSFVFKWRARDFRRRRGRV